MEPDGHNCSRQWDGGSFVMILDTSRKRAGRREQKAARLGVEEVLYRAALSMRVNESNSLLKSATPALLGSPAAQVSVG
jgi:hypothetical protein